MKTTGEIKVWPKGCGYCTATDTGDGAIIFGTMELGFICRECAFIDAQLGLKKAVETKGDK